MVITTLGMPTMQQMMLVIIEQSSPSTFPPITGPNMLTTNEGVDWNQPIVMTNFIC